jgi:double-strand break repair protein MRE11
MHQTLDLLREYCLGDEPVGFQVISDQAASLVGRRGTVNYEDPHYSVGLPVFAIHGNHDDPTREGGDEALAALDLLSVANFVNYFGKADKVDDVTIKPILMKKGVTKVALYGLGNIRDERLNRMWTKQKVPRHRVPGRFFPCPYTPRLPRLLR